MRRRRPFFNTILGVVIAAGCSNVASEPARPDAPVQTSWVSWLDIVSCPNPARANVSAKIGPAGGTLLIGPHKLVVPRGALAKDVTITAKTGDKNGNAIEFKPSGLRFAGFVTLTMNVSNCRGIGLLSVPLIVYTDDLLTILELEPSWFDARSKTVTGYLTHFSRYAVAY